MGKTKEKEKQLGWRTTRGQRGWYFLGRVGTFNLQAIIPAFMNVFLIFNGVDLAVAAVVTFVVKLIDAMDDMIFGFLVDKIDLNKSRLLRKIGGEGKYLPWLRCFMYFFPFAIFLFFLMPQDMSSTAKIIWFSITYLLFDFTYTLVDVPIQSTLQTITEVPEERNHLITWGLVIVTFVAIATNTLQTVLISEEVGLSIRTVGIGCAVVYALMMLPMPFKLKEQNFELQNVEKEMQEKYTLKEMACAIKNNKPYLINVLGQVIPAMLATGTGISLFVNYYLYGSSTAMVVPSLIGMVLAVVCEALAPKLSNKFGNKKSLMASCLVVTLCGFITFIVGYENFGVVVALLLVSTGANGFITMLRSYMCFQSIEYGKYKNGRDTTGIYNAINTFTGKVTSSVASSLGLALLSLFSWTTVNADSFADLAAQGVEQSSSAIAGLWIINSLIPAIGGLIGLVIVGFYGLDDEDAKLMGQCNCGEITREECESKLSKKY
ncbi:MAG: MFS transporter [Agathobacter sp.]|nr:MFS transporter [Agathobacter sp.]